ncbi:MAG TPA: single-stranded DNA-binding protein, partial [Chloroflexota bacterium]|nr:single-stranded DNA-binding protein [Chloroflexota bacterium]
MAGSFNRITIVGNLGRDPEMRYMPSGDPVASFSVATTERWRTRDGQQQERTTWFNVSAFGKLAETCSQFLHKGSYV